MPTDPAKGTKADAGQGVAGHGRHMQRRGKRSIIPAAVDQRVKSALLGAMLTARRMEDADDYQFESRSTYPLKASSIPLFLRVGDAERTRVPDADSMDYLVFENLHALSPNSRKLRGDASLKSHVKAWTLSL
eukprot:TRINITY_DN102643_c0_g1_i1.p1 TRINITY_DN102643_c0_g1~~TRINITY_DN102643_c0_g1_i1.p1  ORF type:complete len:132 (-),score=8.65 TRINITY_DN102643_c0_g1_i1:214-609(-)